jgi:protein SCO1/2
MSNALISGNIFWSKAMRRATRNSEVSSVWAVGMERALARLLILVGLAAAFGLQPLPGCAHDIGLVIPPIELPNVTVMSADGVRAPLSDLLRGRVTAIQLMFSECKSICPIEAATLARVQEALEAVEDNSIDDIQLLSLSIDPTTDTPEVLKVWLERFGAKRGWTAASPAEADLGRVRAFFDRASALGEDHSTVISLVDRNGRLVWRSFELPPPDEVARLLLQLQRSNTDVGKERHVDAP